MKLLSFIRGTWCISSLIRMDRLRLRYVNNQKLTQEDWKIIDRTVISSHILDNYATIVRLRDKTGRERLYPTEGSGNTSNTKLYY